MAKTKHAPAPSPAPMTPEQHDTITAAVDAIADAIAHAQDAPIVVEPPPAVEPPIVDEAVLESFEAAARVAPPSATEVELNGRTLVRTDAGVEVRVPNPAYHEPWGVKHAPPAYLVAVAFTPEEWVAVVEAFPA